MLTPIARLRSMGETPMLLCPCGHRQAGLGRELASFCTIDHRIGFVSHAQSHGPRPPGPVAPGAAENWVCLAESVPDPGRSAIRNRVCFARSLLVSPSPPGNWVCSARMALRGPKAVGQLGLFRTIGGPTGSPSPNPQSRNWLCFARFPLPGTRPTCRPGGIGFVWRNCAPGRVGLAPPIPLGGCELGLFRTFASRPPGPAGNWVRLARSAPVPAGPLSEIGFVWRDGSG